VATSVVDVDIATPTSAPLRPTPARALPPNRTAFSPRRQPRNAGNSRPQTPKRYRPTTRPTPPAPNKTADFQRTFTSWIYRSKSLQEIYTRQQVAAGAAEEARERVEIASLLPADRSRLRFLEPLLLVSPKRSSSVRFDPT